MDPRQSFDLICADQSMNRPGFAQLHYSAEDQSVSVRRMSDVDNKGLTGKHKKSHGQILGEIAHELRSYLEPNPDAVQIREKGLLKIATSGTTIVVLSKVVGVSDLYAWGFGQRIFQEIDPKTVKKLVTGNGLAEKQEVADALEKYVGPQEYACDDWSDAVAVGVAWLIQNKQIEQKLEEE